MSDWTIIVRSLTARLFSTVTTVLRTAAPAKASRWRRRR